MSGGHRKEFDRACSARVRSSARRAPHHRSSSANVVARSFPCSGVSRAASSFFGGAPHPWRLSTASTAAKRPSTYARPRPLYFAACIRAAKRFSSFAQDFGRGTGSRLGGSSLRREAGVCREGPLAGTARAHPALIGFNRVCLLSLLRQVVSEAGRAPGFFSVVLGRSCVLRKKTAHLLGNAYGARGRRGRRRGASAHSPMSLPNRQRPASSST